MKTKMMIVLAVLFSLQSFGQTIGQIFADGGINYRITTATTVQVDSNPITISGAVTIPVTVTNNSLSYTVTSIGLWAFSGCNLITNVVIPNTVTQINYGAFERCSRLTSVNIPNTVTSIGSRAFYYCSALTSVLIPNSLISIDSYAFSGCESLTAVTIPNSVLSIGGAAFSYCINLTTVAGLNSVTSIGGIAFAGCFALTSITIPSGIITISPGTFEYCRSLTSVNIPNGVTSIGNGAFDNCISLTSVIIPNMVASIGNDAFRDCVSLTNVIIPNSVTSIGVSAFQSCLRFTSIVIPNSITAIADGTFQGCTGLTSVSLPQSLTSIGSEAFQHCSALQSVNIPCSVTNIADKAFIACTNLSSVTVNWATPLSMYNNVFGGVNLSAVNLYVPDGSELVYDATPIWTQFGSISNPITAIGSNLTFCNGTTIANIVRSVPGLNWYDVVTGGTVLPNSTIVTTGIYYVSQTGDCLGSARTAIAVTITNTNAPTAVSQTVLFGATVADLIATGTNLQWYDVQTSGTALANSATLTTGTYYVSQTINNCESPRTAVAITILPEYTAIPDNNFELALFNKGIDTVLGDNRVLTAAIINIPALDVSNKGIGDLTGIEAFYSLTELNCSGNFLTSLNINTVVLLQKLNCSENQIASLNLSNQTVLQLVRCEGNLLTTINTNGISTLQEVYCSNNLMTNLDFTAQTNLRKLYCNNNQLTNLNVTGLMQLNQLGCNNNQLVNLNVSDANLSLLNCSNNLLTIIDFRFQEPTLTTFNCQANRFSQMDLRGYSVLTNFNCTLNPYLTCISVDDIAYATANYLKDATASFSPNCFAPIVLNYCRNAVASPLQSPFAAGIFPRWYTVAVGGQASLVSPTPITSTDGTRVYYVSQVWGGIESARIPIIVNTLGLPGTPGAITGTTAQGALVGTTTAASYSVAAIAHATIYNWTVPAGVNIVSGQGTTTLTVNFNNVPAGAGSIGNLMVVATNALGCGNRATRNLPLTKALPAAPTAITLTHAGVVTTNISNYIGQPTVLTLTATPVVGVTTYEWDLPYGINVLSGALPVRGGASGGNIITVNFEGVTADAMFNYTTPTGVLTHVLRVGVRAINGVGASTTSNAGLVNPTTLNTARLLTLTAVLCSAGTIDGGNVTVCAAGTALDTNGVAAVFTNSTTLTLNGNSAGSIAQWQKSFNLSNATNATPAWSTVANTTTVNNNVLINGNTLTASNVTSTVWYRARVTNGSCVTFTNPVKIGVTTLARAGVVTSLSSVCAGGNITFTAAAYTGSAISWEVSTTSATAGFNTVAGENGLTFTMTNAPSTTFYVRSVVTSGACTMARSAVKTITVSPMSVGGTITAGGLVCSGANKLLRIDGSTGSIQWMYSTDAINFISVPKGSEVAPTFSTTSISGTASTYVVNNITGLTYFKAIVKSGVCFSKESNTVKYTVATEAIAGKAEAAASSVCPNDATTIDLVGSKGDITWQKSTNPTAVNPTWVNIAGAVSATLNTGNLTVTTAYKARVTIGSCAPIVTSNVVLVSINCTTGSKQVDTPTEIAEPFSVVAYPNPSNNVFNFKVNGANNETVSILVFDMTGRQIENKAVNASDVENLTLGQNYSSGVYNVIVAQGRNTKTVRLVKK